MSRGKKASGGGTYQVGYGRPPQHKRYKPGQSGNPRGRPKGRRSVAATIQEFLSRKIVVTENGQRRRLSVLEVALRQLGNQAMRGEPKALKFFFELMEQYGEPLTEAPKRETRSYSITSVDPNEAAKEYLRLMNGDD